MQAAFEIFLNGISGVLIGLTVLYAAIKITLWLGDVLSIWQRMAMAHCVRCPYKGDWP